VCVLLLMWKLIMIIDNGNIINWRISVIDNIINDWYYWKKRLLMIILICDNDYYWWNNINDINIIIIEDYYCVMCMNEMYY